MPKRKVRPQDEESDLSAPPSDIESPLQDALPTTPRKKVKREVTEKQPPASNGRSKKKQPSETKSLTVSSNHKSKEEKADTPAGKLKKKQSSKPKPSKSTDDEHSKQNGEVKVEEDFSAEVKPTRKRKTKEEKEAEAMPLAARTATQKLFIGAHVSASGGAHKAVLNAIHIGANAFALFLKSQRKWSNPPLLDDVASSFLSNCKSHDYDSSQHIVPHGSYLVNLAHTDADRTKQAYDSFLDDLQRCERLGIKLYNFHPGNCAGNDRGKAIKHLASNLNRAHKETKSVITLLENMAAGGNVIGTTFEDLRDIISQVEDKTRVGVCLDTCHTFAAGYDLRSPEAFKTTLKQFDETVGLKYLKALHINDSKAPFGSHRDLHANIGTGFLGLRAFHNVINEPAFIGLPLVLETPTSITDDDGEAVKDDKGKPKEGASTWATEIKLLESMLDMDPTSAHFLDLEARLARKGEKGRKQMAEQAQRKLDKETKKANKKERKGIETDDSASELED